MGSAKIEEMLKAATTMQQMKIFETLAIFKYNFE